MVNYIGHKLGLAILLGITLASASIKPAVAEASPDRASMPVVLVPFSSISDTGRDRVIGDIPQINNANTPLQKNQQAVASYTSGMPPSALQLKPPATVNHSALKSQNIIGILSLDSIFTDGFEAPIPENIPPIADAGPAQTLMELTQGQLDGSGSSDPDGTISQYQWQQTLGPQAAIEDSGAEVTNILTPAVGVDTVITFELTVTDNQGASSTALTTVTVQPNITDGDIDGDGIADDNDLFPNDSSDAYDFDEDGIGDNADTDRDGDGIDNDSDWYPNDPSLNAAPVLTITSPLEGATHNSGRLRVTGTLSAAPNTGITVNGIVARLGGTPYGSEFAVMVPLEPGSQEISVTATLLSRKQLTETVSITGGAQDLFLAYADSEHTFAPAAVEFNIINLNQTGIQRIDVDFDGDGSIDQVIDNGFAQTISYDYSQAGIYLPVITVVDTDNISHRNDLVVGIESEAQRNLLLQQVWNGMNAALVSANLELAKEHLFTEDTVGGYGLVFYLLLPFMADIVASYSLLQPVTTELEYGEYLINRDIDGIDRAFFVYLMVDSNGVWRIGRM